MFARIQALAQADHVPMSEEIRRLMAYTMAAMADLAQMSRPTGPHAMLCWTYLPPSLDRWVQGWAQLRHWSLAEAGRRALLIALNAEKGGIIE
jgi:hypothetical protein